MKDSLDRNVQEKGLILSYAIDELFRGVSDPHGNVSVRLDKTHFMIKPSGVTQASLYEIPVIRIVAWGGGMPTSWQVYDRYSEKEMLKPSVDTAHHAQLYIKHEWLQSICHTHTDHVVAHAIAGRSIECVSTEQADLFGGSIRCAPYSGLDSWSDDIDIDEKGVQALLLARHGGLTFADNPMAAVKLAKRMEDIARKNFLASQLTYPGNAMPLPENEIKLWRKRFLKGYGQKK